MDGMTESATAASRPVVAPRPNKPRRAIGTPRRRGTLPPTHMLMSGRVDRNQL